MNRKKIISTISLLGIFLAIIFVVKLHAQTPPPALIVHPSNLDLSLTPGAPQKGVIFLRNNTNRTVTIQTELRNFTAQGEEGGVDLTAGATAYSLADWIKVSPSTVTIKSGVEIPFTYTITPPANAEPGGHFGSIVFATIPSTGTSGNVGASVSEEIATLFLATIPGPVNEQATIESFNTDKSFYEFGPVNFIVRVKNEGGVHVRPSGVITLTNTFGQKSVIGFQGDNVLPGAIRRMPVAFNQNFLIGKYTATLGLAYGTKNTQIYASTSFYAFPVRIGIAILIVILLFFFLRKRLWKAFKVIAKG